MALLHMDGCDIYSSTTDLAARYPGSSVSSIGISTTAGRFGGGCIYPNSSSGVSYLGPIVVTHTTLAIIAGGAFLPRVENDYPIIQFGNSTGNSANNCELSLTFTAAQLILRRGGPSGTILASSASTYPALWHHVEAKATVANSGGTVEVRINGNTVISYTGDTMQSTSGTAGIDRVWFGGYSSVTAPCDDIYVMDTLGTSMNNFIGDCRINTLVPVSDAAAAFTRSTGASNWSCVDEMRTNSDTDYVQSATVGHIDRYGYSDLAAAVATVYGVQAVTWARKTDATARTMRNLVESSGTTSTGASYALLTGYAPYATILTVDPATSTAWTPSGVNSVTAGFEVVS